MSMDPLSKAIERAAEDRRKIERSSPSTEQLFDQTIKQSNLTRRRVQGGMENHDEIDKKRENLTRIGEKAAQTSRTRIIPPSPRAWARTRPGRGKVGKAAQTAFDVLSTRVNQWLISENQKQIIVTSPGDGNGKTNTAINLALSVASSSNMRVLLVDLDLHNPSIHKALGYDVEFGITDLIQGNKTFADIAINPGIQDIIILPGGSTTEADSKMLTGSRIKQFAEEVRERYSDRIVIFDMPPVLGSADVLSFLPVVPNYLLVLEAGKTTRKQLDNCIHVLDHGNLVGTVLNRSSEYDSAYA